MVDHDEARRHTICHKRAKRIAEGFLTDGKFLPINEEELAIAYLAQDAELRALRRVRDAAQKCEPYYRSMEDGSPYGPEAVELIDALAAARGSEKAPAGSTVCGHVLKEPGCMQCALHPPEVP